MIALEIQRIRTPPLLMLYGAYLYLAGMGFSCRRAEEALNNLGVRRSYEAIRGWVQRSGASAKGYFETGEAAVAVVDESKVKDGGSWYPWAARTLELEHEVVSGGIRSYIERMIETVKDRARVFDGYYPCRCGKPEHASNFLRLFALYYNHARRHQTLGEPPDAVAGDTEFERFCNILEVVKG